MSVPIDANFFARRLDHIFDEVANQIVRAAGRRVPHSVAKHRRPRTTANRRRIQRLHRFRIGANGVFRDVHHRQAFGNGVAHGFFGDLLQVIDGPIFDQSANWARTEKSGGFEFQPDLLRNFDDGSNVFFMRARGAVRPNLHARADNFASQGFGVGVSARAGAGQADIHRVDAERFHQVQDFDFLLDAGILDGGILQAIAQSFVVQRDAPAGRNFGAHRGVPIVDEFFELQFVRVPSSVLSIARCSYAAPTKDRACRASCRIRSDKFPLSCR